MGILGQQSDTREDNIVLDISEHEGMCNYKRSHKVFALLRFHSPQKDRPASSVCSLDTVGCCFLRKKRVTYQLTITVSCLC